MRYIRLIIIFLFLPLLLMAGDSTEGITYTIKPLLKQDGPAYFLSVDGASNLPDKASLDITFTYRFPGGDNERYLDYKRCPVANSAYQVRLGPFRRKPPAGEYLFKVVFDPARQPDKVSEYLNKKYQKLEYTAKTEILTLGTSSDDAQAERRQMLNIVRKEGLVLKTVFDDIKAQAPKYQATLRPEEIKALRQWSKGTVDKLESQVQAILLEDELRVFEMVTQAKAQIENSAFLLKSLLQKQDEILAFKEQTINAMGEFNRKLAILVEEVVVLSILTEKEVTKNLKELGIFSLNKDVLLGSLGKIEALINEAPENEPLKDTGKSALMQEVVALSQNLPDMFYDELKQLASEIISVIFLKVPMTEQVKEGIILKVKTLREKIEGK